MTNLVILYADLATVTGWASWGPNRLLASGVWRLPRTGDDVGRFLRSAYDAYHAGLSAGDVTSAVFESPIMRSGNETTIATLRKVYGLAGVFEMACRDLGISCTEADYGTVLKHFTGSGGGKRPAKKRRVVQACRDRGWDPVDDNEADALAGLDWVCHVRAIAVPWPCGALFAGRAVGR